jgi:hypothetical protein
MKTAKDKRKGQNLLQNLHLFSHTLCVLRYTVHATLSTILAVLHLIALIIFCEAPHYVLLFRPFVFSSSSIQTLFCTRTP